MNNNVPCINLETAPRSAIYQPDNAIQASRLYEIYKSYNMNIQIYPMGEFVALIDLDTATQYSIYKSFSNKICKMLVLRNGRRIKSAFTIDTTDITRRLLQNAVDNCKPGITFDDELTYAVAKGLAEAIVGQLVENGEHMEKFIFSLVPALVMTRKTAEVVAYAVGQLMAYGNNNCNMIMVVRGCAVDSQSRQTIIESILKSLLPANT